MITIRTIFSEISFDNSSTEYAIYHIDYPADKSGNPLDEIADAEIIEKGKYCEYGNIIVQTPLAKYSFNKVYSAYNWVAELLDYIDEHRNEKNIFIDMGKLMKHGDDDYHEFDGKLTVELFD